MKKNKFLVSILTISVFVLSTFLASVTYFAADGGQIGHEAVIEFYRDADEKEPPTSTSDSNEKSNIGDEPKVTKPIGRYPQTGEIVKKSLVLSGVLLALSAIYVYVKKQRKEDKGENK